MNEKLSMDRSAILSYWRAVEFFTGRDLPKLQPNHPHTPVFRVHDDEPLPWDATHVFQRYPRRDHQSDKKNWRHTVYVGALRHDTVRELLEKEFGYDDANVFDKQRNGQSCLFSFHVSQNGKPWFDSFVLSSLAWVAGRTIKPGPAHPDWLNGFKSAEESARSTFSHRVALRPDGSKLHPVESTESRSRKVEITRGLSHADLQAIVNAVVGELGIGDLVDLAALRISSMRLGEKTLETEQEPPLLNSFFLSDLAHVAASARAGDIGPGLEEYLHEDLNTKISARTDIRRDPQSVFKGLAPCLFPSGRWPGAGHHPLVVSQQFAVNAAFEHLGDSAGLFAVNGPPGTGKTTLLRDLVAEVVVRRAVAFATLTNPDAAFADEASRWQSGDYTRQLSHWRPEFQGHEIVIASSNNGAVSNISLELPGVDAVDSDWLIELDYFPGVANLISGMKGASWGLIAACLGNRANCQKFLSPFWYGVERDNNQSTDEPPPSMQQLLNTYRSTTVDWQAAVEQFRHATRTEGSLRAVRVIAYELQQSIMTTQSEHETQALLVDEVARMAKRARTGVDEIRARLAILDSNLDEVVQRRLTNRRFRPGLLETLFSLGRAFRQWRVRDVELANSQDIAERARNDAMQECNARELKYKKCQSRHDHGVAVLGNLSVQLEADQNRLQSLVDHHGLSLPNVDEWADEKQRESASPWADDNWNTARARVFVEALRLHQAFIAANAGRIQSNLRGAMDILSGRVPDSVDEKGLRAAWTTFFMVVPVVSTTFASFARLFSGLGKQSLGWLLIDEAGQALPQAAAGAIWRSRRSVIVGDPLQLEPVSTIPLSAQDALRQRFGVSDTWLPGKTSVQQLADRVNRVGTMVPTDDEPVWIGTPLRVHRRCDNPMFMISNRIAYDDLMVFGTTPRDHYAAMPSSWIDIVSAECDGHWIPAEGRAVESLLSSLMSSGVLTRDIFLVSPFRSIAIELWQLCRNPAYAGVRAGTIHTTQGKEADVVICVLGTDPDKPGARAWASGKPNLLNVAVSRAKRRLYIVGNRSIWSQCRYFSTCSELLPASSLSTIKNLA